MGVNRNVPLLRKILDRAHVVKVTMRQDDRPRKDVRGSAVLPSRRDCVKGDYIVIGDRNFVRNSWTVMQQTRRRA